MKVLITGASGLIGSAAGARLQLRGDTVVHMVRRTVRDADSEVRWNPDKGEIDAASLEGLDAVMHLAGENIASGRWTKRRRQRIWSSRVAGTQLLCRALTSIETPPSVLIAASAVGFYGDCDEREIDESDRNGQGFLAELCNEWEKATHPCKEAGIRVVTARLGVVLASGGGALARMLPAFRWGLGGRIGSGRQFMCWISLDDCVEALLYCLDNNELNGVTNVVSPGPVTNNEFTRILTKTLNRWAILPVPELMIRLLFGEMGVETILASCRARPKQLIDSGFQFRHADLSSALKAALKG